jgi:pyruvate/2-oxoglutarate dehydrogenase complex dihydrolipoamide acyltransferase (E2) component
VSLELRLPDVGEGLSGAELVEWRVGVGEAVSEDQMLAEIQTDKAIVELPSPAAGTIERLCAEPGDTVAVGEVVVVIATTDRSPRPLAAPAVRRRARELGIDLASVTGSGPGGRIVHDDLRAEPRPIAPRSGEVVPLRGLRRTIAQTLTEAWQTVPRVIDYREVDAGALLDARAQLGVRTVSPLLMKIVAVALRGHPLLNASIDLEREEITLHAAINLGVATATPDGLLVPVIHDAGAKSIVELGEAARELAAAARERRLTPDQLRGGTITVNNYGGLGIWLGTPIVVPPQVANIGFGKIERKPVVRDGEIVAGTVLPIACAGDHRLLDGDTIAAFVNDLSALIERPYTLLGELA